MIYSVSLIMSPWPADSNELERSEGGQGSRSSILVRDLAHSPMQSRRLCGVSVTGSQCSVVRMVTAMQ